VAPDAVDDQRCQSRPIGRLAGEGRPMARKLCAGVAVGALLLIGSGGGASADHLVGGDESGCWIGEQATDIPLEIGTDDVRYKTFEDGRVRLTCFFRDLPSYVAWDAPGNNRGVEYTAPTRATFGYLTPICYRYETDEYRSGSFLIRPNGTGKLVCEFGPSSPLTRP
jgi:hypothetical protein